MIAGVANAAPVYSANGAVGSNVEAGKRPGSLVAVLNVSQNFERWKCG